MPALSGGGLMAFGGRVAEKHGGLQETEVANEENYINIFCLAIWQGLLRLVAARFLEDLPHPGLFLMLF
ncbi:hypothetical protein E4U59_006561 [Claviceps monticola]|nr:hypothetical protein E4U59_006561 [Claviceps monticola]